MRKVLLHGHIFKNAGTTLDWSLERSFGARFLDHRRDSVMRTDAQNELDHLLSEDQELLAISSHSMPCPAPSVDNISFTSLVMLRQPLRRARSVYDFERKQVSDTPGAKAAKEKTYQAYVDWRMQENVGPTIRNFQTRYLSGQRFRWKGASLVEKDLFHALESIDENVIVGIVERYDESMVLAEYQLQTGFPDLDLSYVRQNVAKRGLFKRAEPWYSGLGDGVDTLIENNALDLVLYQEFNRRLDVALADVPDFEERLSDFRARCASLKRR